MAASWKMLQRPQTEFVQINVAGFHARDDQVEVVSTAIESLGLQAIDKWARLEMLLSRVFFATPASSAEVHAPGRQGQK
jgi:TPP-dependent trihydroxycyclohexane-1,2-dione (THcHDO) dehydratase